MACTMAAAMPAQADSPVRDATRQHQQQQQVLQQKIDNADDETRELLRQLRDARESADRLEQHNRTVAPMLERQQQRIERQRQALASMDATDEALPATLQNMVKQLRALVRADIPFHQRERMARLDSLDRMLGEASMSRADKLKRVLSAWQQELDYGTGIEAWQGPLHGDADTRVQYLRLGRVGWYYLTLDGHRGSIWQAGSGEWQPLDGDALEEVRRGVKIANDQRSPELLSLPLSVALSDSAGESSSASTENDERPESDRRSGTASAAGNNGSDS
ncbi:DUF3450 domain-containing protein [Kushneria sinocarnis]|nr:DUF3450 domain-containing protein [Kushneria sinocarnis]